VKQAIRKTHVGLTDKDLQLCCHIAEGLTTGEIAHIAFQGVSTVTARRSRLRTKLGLKEGDSLRDYITMLVNREM
jgi:DNA-binding CsgD family transcriptional regulator